MNFKDIYEELINGKKIRRKSWKEGSWININNLKTLGKESLTAEDWEIVEEKKKKKQWWEPEEHGEYWSIESNGQVEMHFKLNVLSFEKEKIMFGNCFQTEKQAEFMAEKLRVIHELEKFAFENNEEEIDWNNSEQRKYYLYFDYTDMSIVSCDSYSKCQHIPLAVYFTSKEIADKSIKAIGEERLKKYYFGVIMNNQKFNEYKEKMYNKMKEIKERIVNENRVYKCIKDYQLSPLVDPEEGFCMGLTKTVREWRTAALEWSDSRDFIEDIKIKLHELTGQELMDYISDIWEIGFEEVK